MQVARIYFSRVLCDFTYNFDAQSPMVFYNLLKANNFLLCKKRYVF